MSKSIGGYSVTRQHSGTEDGMLWYVLDASGNRVDGGYAYKDSASESAADLAKLAALTENERAAVETMRAECPAAGDFGVAVLDGAGVVEYRYATGQDRNAPIPPHAVAALVDETRADYRGTPHVLVTVDGTREDMSAAARERERVASHPVFASLSDTAREVIADNGATKVADSLAAVSALVLDIREIEAGEHSADARDAHAGNVARLRDMLAALMPSVLMDCPDDVLRLAGDDYAALAAVWSALYRAGVRDVWTVGTMRNDDCMPLSAEDGAAVLEWSRDFARDCVWGDIDSEDVADLDAATILRGAARHYDGGIAALVRDALALPRTLAKANTNAAVGGLNRERERYAVAAKLARDAVPSILARADVAGTVHSGETLRELACELADILNDADALTAAKLVDALPATALAALADILNEGLRSCDVNRHELVSATRIMREVAALADSTIGRGDDWHEVGARLRYALTAAREVAKTARGHMRANDAAYFTGDGQDAAEVGMPRAE